ncbi:MAG: S8 family serine peptidase [Acidimicrobiia bacterium]
MSATSGLLRALRRVVSLVSVVSVAMSCILIVPGGSVTRAAPAAGSYIVTFASAADLQRFVASAPTQGLAITQVLDSVFDGVVVQLDSVQLRRIRAVGRVMRIEPNQVVKASDAPPSWGLDRIDQRALPLDDSFGPPPQWGQGVTAYIVDTGVNRSHSEFAGRLVSGFDVVNPSGNADDCNGHGTHVAATVAGASFGVARAATIVPVRVLDCLGGGTTAGVISGLDWVVEHHQTGVPAVLNMSLGGGYSAALNTAVDRVVADGVTVVVAAGNENADACRRSPASAATAITVGATTSSDTRASYSNIGPCLDLFAPGSSIVSAWIGGSQSTNTLSGTSMASPHVAGAVAAFLSAWPSASPAAVASGVLASATVGVVGDGGGGSPNGLLYVDAQWSPGTTNPPPSSGAPLPTSPSTTSTTVTTSPTPVPPTLPITRPTRPPSVPPSTFPRPTSPPTTVRPPSRPFIPQIESVEAGDRSVTVSASLAGYSGQVYTTITFTSSPSGRSCTVEVTGSRGNSCTVSGLTNGTAYTFTAVAENAGGSSSTSSRSDSVTPADPNRVPGVPSGPAASVDRYSRTTVVLTWNPPRDNGAVVTEYRIEYRRNNGYGGSDQRISTNRHEIRYQRKGDVITFRVRACNPRGSCSSWSDWSNGAVVG